MKVRNILPLLATAVLLTTAGCSTDNAERDDESVQADHPKNELEECRRLADAYDLTFFDMASTVGREVTANELADERLATYVKLADAVRADLDLAESEAASFLVRKGRLVLVLKHEIFFNSTKTELGPGAPAALDDLAATLQKIKDRDFIIAAHTDSQPVSGKDDRFLTNRELSLHRAYEVVDGLVARGVDPTRLARVGWGEHRRLVAGDDEVANAKNRRIEVVFQLTDTERPTFLPSDSPLVSAPPAPQVEGGAQ